MLLRAEEVGVVLGVSRARVHQLIRQGILPSVRLGRQVRVDQAELRKWTRSGGRSLPGGWRRTEPGEGGTGDQVARGDHPQGSTSDGG